MNRIARTVTAASVALAAFAIAAPGQALASPGPRWEKPALTVHIADEAAWAGTDVPAALAQWSPALPLTLTDDPGADIILAGPVAVSSVEGATAHRGGHDGQITSCRVVLGAPFAGGDNTSVLAHELGHCVGLGHNNLGASSVMYWIEGGEHFSPTVTTTDLNNVRSLYR